jgi:hypothetical protein
MTKVLNDSNHFGLAPPDGTPVDGLGVFEDGFLWVEQPDAEELLRLTSRELEELLHCVGAEDGLPGLVKRNQANDESTYRISVEGLVALCAAYTAMQPISAEEADRRGWWTLDQLCAVLRRPEQFVIEKLARLGLSDVMCPMPMVTVPVLEAGATAPTLRYAPGVRDMMLRTNDDGR